MADDLAEVLRLLHDSDRRWRTLRAEGDQSRADLDAGAIVTAASRAETLWP